MNRWSLLASNLAFLLATTSAQNPPAAPPRDHDSAHRGEQGMGFPQDATSHHFLLRPDGGVVQVTADSAADTAGIEHIRMHLEHIRGAFEAGDFSIPGFVHNQAPPGVPTMVKFKDEIRYKYEEIAQGGRLTISSKNAEAVSAIQSFLRFQITEHKTGDPLEVK
ncbi:MAG TPA: hypothetical protein VIX19_16920 [Terriglobales bacterium]